MHILAESVIGDPTVKEAVEIGIMENAEAGHCISIRHRSGMKAVLVSKIHDDDIILSLDDTGRQVVPPKYREVACKPRQRIEPIVFTANDSDFMAAIAQRLGYCSA